jgi:putative ABC transport system permease protein
MLRNYLSLSFRRLFRNKFHTTINLVGLVIGFTIGLVVLLAVYGQFTFDRNHVNRDKIYQAYHVFHKASGDEIGSSFGFPAAERFKAEAAAVDRSTRFLYGSNAVHYKEKEVDITTMLVDEDFLKMFTFPILKGNAANPLSSLSNIIITEKTAKIIFGDEDPVGKTIKSPYGGKLKEMIVAAVVKDIPRNSTVDFDAIARVEVRPDYAVDKTNWNNQHHPVFLQLKDNATVQQAEQQLRTINKKYLADWSVSLKGDGAVPDKKGDVFTTRLLSLKDLHFSPGINNVGNSVNKAELVAMLAISLLIILIACFNFVNINLANAFTRSKEIGVRKCLGAAKNNLFAQLWSESFIVCSIAFLFSLLLTNIIIGVIQRQSPSNMPLHELLWNPGYLLMTFGLLLLVSFIAGGYPSWLMAKLKVVESLKGKISLKRKSITRSSLIVMQFVIACIMISCTLIIYRQFKFLQNADLGVNKEYVIAIPFHKPEKGLANIEKLRLRLSSNPAILSLTGSSINIGLGKDGMSTRISNRFGYKEKEISTNMADIEYDYLKTFGIKPIEGNDIDLSYAADSLPQVLITESLAKQFNEKQIVGQKIVVDSGAPAWNIVAVIPDFHLYSMREEKQPLALMMKKNTGIRYCFIKTNAQNKVAVMEAVKKEMAILEPGREFKGSFMDDNINNWYKQEKMMSIILSIAAAIAIALSCMGLLAMVLLIIQQRIKEIGVRKVLGASVPNISYLISKEFLLLVLIAVLIATPISWLAMSKWLQSFAYRIDINIWMFILVAVIALLFAFITICYNTVKAAVANPVKSLRTE